MSIWNMRGHRGGLSTLVSTLVLIVLVVGGLVGIALYYSTISSGAVSQAHLIFSGSVIKVDANAETGYVYLKIYNEGPGSVRLSQIDLVGDHTWSVYFDYAWVNPRNSDSNVADCTYNGSPGIGYAGVSGSASMILPAGATMSLYCNFPGVLGAKLHNIPYYFEPGTTYPGIVKPTQAAEQPFTIPSESAP